MMALERKQKQKQKRKRNAKFVADPPSDSTGDSDGEVLPRKTRKKTQQPAVAEDLQLARHILSRLLADRRARDLFHGSAAPEQMTDEYGRAILDFVRETLLSNEPTAAFARVCLVPGDPVAPDARTRALLGALSAADFERFWPRLGQIFPDGSITFHFATTAVVGMFLRGASALAAAAAAAVGPPLLPLGWSRDANLGAFTRYLPCAEFLRVLPLPAEEEAAFGRFGHFVHATLRAPYLPPAPDAENAGLRSLADWLRPENEASARNLAERIERGFRRWSVPWFRAKSGAKPDPDLTRAIAYESAEDREFVADRVAWLGIAFFDVLVVGYPGEEGGHPGANASDIDGDNDSRTIFALATSALAPLEHLRAGLLRDLRDEEFVAAICARVERAVAGARAGYAREVAAAGVFRASPVSMPALVASYCVQV